MCSPETITSSGSITIWRPAALEACSPVARSISYSRRILTELDPLEGVDDRVQLTLVERSPGRPAAADPDGGAADQRVEVAVERLAHLALDPLHVGARRGLEVDHDRDGTEAHRQQSHRRPDELAGVEVALDLVEQRLVRGQLLDRQPPVRRVDPRQDPQRDARARRPDARARATRGVASVARNS